MDISLIPLNIYKIPKDCSHILITPNIMFTKQLVNAFDLNTEKKEKSKKQQKQSQQQQQQLQKTDNNISNKNVKTDESIMNGENDVNENNKMINSVGVIGCNATALRIGEDSVSVSRSLFTVIFAHFNINFFRILRNRQC